MNTEFMLMAQYNGAPLIKVDDVRRNYFAELTLSTFIRKLESGDIPLPVVRLNPTQKGTKSIALVDLADYIDKQHQTAHRIFGKA